MGQRIPREKLFSGEVCDCVRDLSLIANLWRSQDGLKDLMTPHRKLFFDEAHGYVQDLSLIASSGHILGRPMGPSRHHVKPGFERSPNHGHYLLRQNSEVMVWMHHLGGLSNWITERTSC
jgi:hypothetical protein